MKDYIRLMRPHHWIKNLLVFLPLIFHGALFNTALLGLLGLGFLAFCLVSSAVYIINDLFDVERDRQHSTKRHRPIASGAVSPKAAAGLATALLAATLLLLAVLWAASSGWPLLVLAAYLAINFFYSSKGKHIPILDVFLLMAGYLLRILFGSLLTGIPLSAWMYLTVMSGAFYLGFGKRRNELLHEEDTRGVLRSYNRSFLDMSMYLCLALSIVFYALWCVEGPAVRLFSVPFLMAILFKYSLNVEKSADGDPVEVILRDKALLGMIVLFAAFLFVILYVVKP